MRFFVFCIFCIQISLAQDFSQVDEKVKNYPKFSNVQDLAHQIEKDFTTNLDKVRAAFTWLAFNINYDLQELYNPTKRSYRFQYSSEEEKQQKLQALKDELINKAFRSKKGVCEEYAQSFSKVCDLLGIESEVIKGYARNNPLEIGKPFKNSNHAWNAVKIDEKWLLIDATWAAGFEQNGVWIKQFTPYYFNIPHTKILKSHLPFDPLWVLRFGRISEEEFYNQPLFAEEFLSSKATLVSPKNGIIKQTNDDVIVFKIKDLALTDEIFVGISGLQFAQKPEVKIDGAITTIKIKNPKKQGIITLIINQKNAIYFKMI